MGIVNQTTKTKVGLRSMIGRQRDTKKYMNVIHHYNYDSIEDLDIRSGWIINLVIEGVGVIQ